MRRIEDILDNAIKRVKNGEEISTVLLACPKELREQLSANLNLIKLGLSLPKRQIPAPARRMFFLQVAPQPKISKLSQFFSVYAMAFTVLLLVVGGTALAAASSVPGEKLFTLKRSFEAAQLKLARNPEERAKLQLTFANSRLQEVNELLAKNDQGQANIAIDALNSQTEQALSNIKEIVANNPSVSKDPGIVSTVKSLATNQAQLVTKVAQSKPADPQIAATTQKTVENLQKLIAASNDQAAVDLPVATIDSTGPITALSGTSITIDKNTFDTDQNTVIKDLSGNTIDFSSLALGDTVEIKGQVKDQKNQAETVTLVSKAPVQNVPAADSKPDTKPKAANPATVAPDSRQIMPDDTIPAQQSQDDTFGGFIPETPAQTGN